MRNPCAAGGIPHPASKHAGILKTVRGVKSDMAIYHMNVKIGRRADKQSAFAAASYILRTGDYAAGYDEVLYSDSGHMPAFADADPLRFWDAADVYERDNGRLFRSVEFALPIEADEDRRRDLAVMFAHSLTAEKKLPFTLAIHAGKGHNPHCHLLINERSNDGVIRPAELWFRRHNGKEPGRGGAKKTDALVTKSWLRNTRKAWADLCNQTLEDDGYDARIDHRSLKEQGIGRAPKKHLGPKLHAMLKKGIDVEIAAEIGMSASDIGPPAPSPFVPARRQTPPRSSTDMTRVPDKERRASQTKTAPAVQLQADAMGCDYYDIVIEQTGKLVKERWTLQLLLDNLQRLIDLNRQGRNILIRPSSRQLPGLVLVDGLDNDNVERMRADGYEPTLTLETAPGQYQVWVRIEDGHTKSRRDKIARHLAERYGGDVDAAGANSYGRLAGFTSGESLIEDRRPFVTLKQSDPSGKIASAAADVLRATRPATLRQPDGQAPGESDPGAG